VLYQGQKHAFWSMSWQYRLALSNIVRIYSKWANVQIYFK